MEMRRNEIPELESILKSSHDPLVRESVLMAIGKNGFTEMGSLVMKLAEQDDTPRVRQVAIATLVKIRYRECVPYFRQCISCNSAKTPNQLNYAVYALGEFRCEKSIDDMIAICRVTDNEALKASVIKALGKIIEGVTGVRRTQIVEFITSYKNDPSAILALAADYVLGKIGGN